MQGKMKKINNEMKVTVLKLKLEKLFRSKTEVSSNKRL